MVYVITLIKIRRRKPLSNLLFWIYLINAVLLISHEIDSAYWKEWKLFKLPGGITGFLLIHFPLLFLILYGLVLIYEKAFSGLIISLLLSFGGIFAFFIHTYFIKKGNEEFKTAISMFILIATFIISLIQLIITIVIIFMNIQ